MRRIVIQGAPPQLWLVKAEAIITKLRAAVNEKEREQIIEANEKLWRDPLIRDWLLEQFYNKCWYTEAYDSVSSIPVSYTHLTLPTNREV